MQLFALTLDLRDDAELANALLTPATVARIHSAVAASPSVAEAVLLTTCLRVELYGVARDPRAVRVTFREQLERITGLALHESKVTLLDARAAARHLFAVTGGLASILFGETAVTGQVRAAYRASVDRSLCGPMLHRIFHHAFRTARRLRTEGQVTAIASSLSSLALRMAREAAPMGADRLLVIGAGQAGQAALRSARGWGFHHVTLAGSRAEEVEALAAEHGAGSLPLPQGIESTTLRTSLRSVDVVLAASSRGLLLRAADFEPHDGALLVYDLGRPHNVEAELPAPIRRFDLHDLEHRAREEADLRPLGPERAPWQVILDEAVESYSAWLEERSARVDTGVASDSVTRAGRVYLVGAGPGDPELLTLRAARLLEEADVVLHDALLPPALLARIPAGVRRVPVGRRVGAVVAEQTDTSRAMVEWARLGAKVVRLKGGDPALFARLSEELAELAEAGIEYEVVPGVTAALASAAAAGVSLTARGMAASCAFISFHAAGDASPERRARFIQLARATESLAVYMGSQEIAALASALIDAGHSPEEPVLIVERASHPEERARRFALAELISAPPKLETPALVLAGPTVRANWLSEEKKIEPLRAAT